DFAISRIAAVNSFLQQSTGEHPSATQTVDRLKSMF
ncbi:MAG: hypothetical protein JO097_13150, partial [Acidobacteriaceae bacterium]|nr:hypothetical protein [Acidobacteriaceae bacterium]MBV9294084.1 hypothetical protein [Acidobacteriaceae bacterium]